MVMFVNLLITFITVMNYGFSMKEKILSGRMDKQRQS